MVMTELLEQVHNFSVLVVDNLDGRRFLRERNGSGATKRLDPCIMRREHGDNAGGEPLFGSIIAKGWLDPADVCQVDPSRRD